MADIELHREHDLGVEGARAAADRMMEHLSGRFGLQGEWQGNVLHFKRPGVTGSLAVDERRLDLSVTLGFLLKSMKGSIETAVVREIDALFRPGGGPSSGERRA